MPPEVYSQIIEKIKSIWLLTKPGGPSPTEKFQLALSLREEVTRLDLSYFEELDNEKLRSLQERCPNLRSLALTTMSLYKKNLSNLASFSKLESLDLSVTDICELNMLPKSLKNLNLSWCTNLTKEVSQMLKNFPQIEKLDLPPLLSSSCTLDLVSKDLKELSLADWDSLEPKELQKLNTFSKLEKLTPLSIPLEQILDIFPKSLKKLDLSFISPIFLQVETLCNLAFIDHLQVIYLPLKYVYGDQQTISDKKTLIAFLKEHKKQVILK